MDGLGLASMSYFSLYALLTGIFIASHFIFQSKNMRTIIFMPIVIGIAQELKIDILSLAIPVALCINVAGASRLMLNRTQCFTVQINIRWANLSTMASLCLFSTGWVWCLPEQLILNGSASLPDSSNEIMIRCAAKFPKTLRHDVFPSSLVGLFCRRTHAHRRD